MTDEQLLQLLLEDPEAGCRQLLLQYTDLVYAIVRRRLGGCCNAGELEEICSDILFAFYQKRSQIDLSRGTIRALLTTIAGRMCIDRYRQCVKRPTRVSSETVTLAETLEDESPTPEMQLLQKEQNANLIAAVHALGEPDTSIVLWRYFFGASAAEIAARLSMRRGTVEVRLSRAIKKLRKRLGGESDAL